MTFDKEMKKIAYITLGLALGSLITNYFNGREDSKRSLIEPKVGTVLPNEDEKNFPYELFFDLVELQQHETPNPLGGSYDFAEVQYDEFMSELLTEASNNNDPRYLASEEWKSRDYGLYVFPNNQ